jgi:hypothetical protein
VRAILAESPDCPAAQCADEYGIEGLATWRFAGPCANHTAPAVPIPLIQDGRALASRFSRADHNRNSCSASWLYPGHVTIQKPSRSLWEARYARAFIGQPLSGVVSSSSNRRMPVGRQRSTTASTITGWSSSMRSTARHDRSQRGRWRNPSAERVDSALYSSSISLSAAWSEE